jgi:O-antigen ligase
VRTPTHSLIKSQRVIGVGVTVLTVCLTLLVARFGPITLAVILLPTLLCSPRLAVSMAVLLGIYRLPAPALHVGFGLTLGTEELAVLILAGTWLLRARRYLSGFDKRLWLLALGLSQALSDAVSIPLSLDIRRSVVDFILCVTTAIAIMGVASWSKERENLKFLCSALLGGGLLAALLAILKIHGPYGAMTLDPGTLVGNVTRITGVSGNFLASLLTVSAVIALAWLLNGRFSIYLAAIFVGLVAAIVLTFARGSYIDLIISTFFVVLLSRRGRGWSVRVMILTIALSAGAALTFSTSNPVHNRFSELTHSQTATTLNTREELWASAVRVWEHVPVTGAGAKNYNLALNRFDPGTLPTIWYTVFQYPEQQLLGLADETGALGLAMYLFSSTYLISQLVRRRHRLDLEVWLVPIVLSLSAARLISEIAGTWLSGNLFLLLIWGIALGVLWEPAHVRTLLLDRDISERQILPPAREYLAGATR